MPITDYTYGTKNIREHNYFVYLKETGDKLDFAGKKWSEADTSINSSGFTKIGGCDAKPSIKVASGTKKKIAGGEEILGSEKVDFQCKDLEVTSENYHAIRKTAKAGNVDVMFKCDKTKRVTILHDVPITANLTVQGEDFDTVEIAASLQTVDADNNITFVTSWTPES